MGTYGEWEAYMGKKGIRSVIILFQAFMLLLGALLFATIGSSTAAALTGEGALQAPETLVDLQTADDAQLGYWAESLNAFDGRKFDYITAEKNQGGLGICWAFAAIGAMEANILRDGVDPEVDRMSLDLDEIIAAYARFNREGENDPLNLTTNDTYTSDDWRGSGGFAHEAFMSMSQGFSPDQQTIDNQGANDWYIKQAITQSKYFVQGFKQIDHNNEAIKRAILEYGAVTMEYKAPDATYQQYVYHEGNSLGHASLIVGWDDSVSSTLFRPDHPASDGAWIVKNSWGSGGERVNGTYCFYLSYDAHMSDNLYVVDMGLRDDYQNIYYYDGHITDNSNRTYADAYGAIYQAKLSSAAKKEQLTAVSFGLTSTKSTVDIEIYKLDSANLISVNDEINRPDSGRLVGRKEKVYFEDDGFYTVDLDEPIDLEQGEIFSIVISGKDANGSYISPMVAFDNSESVNDMTYSRYEGQWTSFKGYKNSYADNSPGSCVRLRGITNLAPRDYPLDSDLQYARIDLESSFVYYEKDKVQKPAITVYFDDHILKEDEDYSVDYVNNSKPGIATVTVTGMNYYSGVRTLEFEIAKPKTPPGAVSLIEVYSDITRLRQVPLPRDWKWNEGDITLANGDSGFGYSAIYIGDDADCYQKKTQSVHIFRHTESRPATFDISEAVVAVEGKYVYTYTGSAIVPKLRVFVKGHELNINDDYTLEYSGNINAGKATIIVKGCGTYTGQASKEFEIKKAQWPSERPNYTIDVGEDVTDINQISLNCSGWSWRVQHQEIAGDETKAIAVYIGQGLNNYINTKMDITIVRRAQSEEKDIASIDRLELSQTEYEYSGDACAPDIIAKDGNYSLVKGRDFVVTYLENVNVGNAKAIVRGINNYSGTKTLYFAIKRADVQGFSVSQAGWIYGETAPEPSVEGQIDGAKITYTYSDREDGNFIEAKPTNAGTYWIKAEMEQSQNYNAAMATARFVIEKATQPKQMPNSVIYIERKTETLQSVALAVGWQWEEPQTRIEAETTFAWAVYSDRENYEVYRIEIAVTKEAPMAAAGLSVYLEAENFVYDGAEKTPRIIAMDGESELILGADYDVGYSNNKFAGQGKAIVTFKNDYQGTRELVFLIAQAERPSVDTTIRCANVAKLKDIPLPSGFYWEDEDMEILGNRFTAKAVYRGEDASSYKTTEILFEIFLEDEGQQQPEPKHKNLIWLAIALPAAALIVGAGCAIAIRRRKKQRR